jgi:glycosyltransferase involved in cell wall biosynthesis
MIAVEAQAAGAPVIAFGRGGAVETVVPVGDPAGRAPTGVHFREPTPASLARAVRDFTEVEAKLDPLALRENAERFSLENFRSGLRRVIDEVVR